MAFSAPSEDIVPEGDDLRGAIAAEDVIRGQIVKITEAGFPPRVEPSDADGEDVYGIVTQTVSSGETCTVATEGTEANFTAGTGTVSAGDYLTSHGGTGEEGQVDTASATGDSLVGVAYQASSSQGDLVKGLLTLGGEVN